MDRRINESGRDYVPQEEIKIPPVFVYEGDQVVYAVNQTELVDGLNSDRFTIRFLSRSDTDPDRHYKETF